MPAYRVLVIEDQSEVRRMLRSALESISPDFLVMDVPSGEEALLLLSHQPIDLAVIDVRLAGISGLELMRKVKTRAPDLKTILITGMTDPEIRKQVAGAGADAFFYKPVEMPDFLAAVDRCRGGVSSEDGAPMTWEEVKRPETDLVDKFEVPASGKDERQGEDLSGHLSALQSSLEAHSVFLLNPQGLLLAKVGDLPGDLQESTLVASLKPLLGAGGQVSSLLNPGDPILLAGFYGREQDLYLGQSGQVTLAILVSSQQGDTVRGLDRARLSVEMGRFFERIQIVDPSSSRFDGGSPRFGNQKDEPVREAAPELVEIFRQAELSPADSIDLDDFWGELPEQSEGDPRPGSGMLSFEQARKLGMAPDP